MLFAWRWLILCNSVFLIYGLDFCQLPMSPVCKAPNTQYVGTEIKSIENVEDYDSCAVLCLWRSDCTAQSYHEVTKDCTLFSKVNSCKNKQKGWTSSTGCYISENGKWYEWVVVNTTDFKMGLNGELAADAGSTISITCRIPGLDDMIKIESINWFKRNSEKDEKVRLEETDLVLRFDAVTKNHAGIYSCEMSFFGGMTISSPETDFKVLYMEKTFQQYPEDVFYKSSSSHVILKCTAPDSYPKAVIEWYKTNEYTSVSGSRVIDTRISEVLNLVYLIIEDYLVLFNPSRTVDGNYVCKARNMWLGKIEQTDQIQVRSSTEFEPSSEIAIQELEVPKISVGTIQKLLKGSEIAANVVAHSLTQQKGVWIEEQLAFRCVLLNNIGKDIEWWWGNGTVIDDAAVGISFAEGNQALVFRPDKIKEFIDDGITQIKCSDEKKVYYMDLPSVENLNFAEETTTKNIMVDIQQDTETALKNLEHLFKDYESQENVIIAQINSPVIGGTNIQYLLTYVAVNAAVTVCPDYEYLTLKKDLIFSKSLIQEIIEIECPTGGSVIGKCHLNSPSKVTWSVWMTDDCDLNKISYQALQSLTISADNDDTTIFHMDGGLRAISIETLFSALQFNTIYYSSDIMLTKVLETLVHIKESPTISASFRKQSDWLLKFYIEFLQPSDGVITFSDDQLSTLLWTINFPLKKDANLSYSPSGNVPDLSLNMPRELNTLMNGSQSFLISLYNQPEYFSALKGKDGTYVSKLVDIDPPQILSNLSTDQEITIGLTISHLVQAYQNPQCYWFDPTDSTWKTDGVSTLGFTEENLFECQTNHLTAFSVLVSPNRLSIDHEMILTYLTQVGGTVSCLALFLTIIALSSFREIRRSNTTKIHICLATTMLLATLLFLAGIDQTEVPIVCTIIAISLHYLWLTVFTWTVVEAYNLYLLFIRVLTSHGSSFIFKLGAPALTLPAVITAGTACLSFESYTHHFYCFLGGNMVYYALVAPVGVAFIINGGVFATVIYKIFNKAKYQNFESKAQKILSQMKAISTLACVLGLSWVFGFLTFEHQASIVFHYLFAIFNTLQGLVIFVFHCVIKPDVRKKWLFVIFSIGTDTRSGRTSRITTPSKSRLDLLPGFFRKRSSTGTLSTTATKLSLTKQLTRQRTDSNSSINIGLVNGNTLIKKVSLEPVEEKESIAKEEMEKKPLQPMLSSHSSSGVSCTDLTANIVPLTPPGGDNSFSFESKSLNHNNTPSSRRSLPRKISPTATKVKKILSDYLQNTSSFTEENIVRQNSLVVIDKKKLRRTNDGASNPRPIQTSAERVMRHQSLEDRLRMDKIGENPGETNSGASSSHSTARSASPFNLKNRWKISPIPPKLDPDAAYSDAGSSRAFTTPDNFTVDNDYDVDEVMSIDEETKISDQIIPKSLIRGPESETMLPPIWNTDKRYSLEVDTSGISSKLANLKEWDWSY